MDFIIITIVMKLVDMIDLGSVDSNIVQVQVLPIVILNIKNPFLSLLEYKSTIYIPETLLCSVSRNLNSVEVFRKLLLIL
jgi:hypothetical protein